VSGYRKNRLSGLAALKFSKMTKRTPKDFALKVGIFHFAPLSLSMIKDVRHLVMTIQKNYFKPLRHLLSTFH